MYFFIKKNSDFLASIKMFVHANKKTILFAHHNHQHHQERSEGGMEGQL